MSEYGASPRRRWLLLLCVIAFLLLMAYVAFTLAHPAPQPGPPPDFDF